MYLENNKYMYLSFCLPMLYLFMLGPQGWQTGICKWTLWTIKLFLETRATSPSLMYISKVVTHIWSNLLPHWYDLCLELRYISYLLENLLMVWSQLNLLLHQYLLWVDREAAFTPFPSSSCLETQTSSVGFSFLFLSAEIRVKIGTVPVEKDTQALTTQVLRHWENT